METKRFIRPIHWCTECGRPFYAWKSEEHRCPLCRTFARFLRDADVVLTRSHEDTKGHEEKCKNGTVRNVAKDSGSSRLP